MAVALPVPDAKQATIWLGALLAMFILYLAMNNRLALYWSLLTGGLQAATTSQPGAATAPAPSGTSAGSSGTSSSGTPRLFIPSNPAAPPS